MLLEKRLPIGQIRHAHQETKKVQKTKKKFKKLILCYCFNIASRLKAIAIRLEAVASRLEAIASSTEAIDSRLEAIASIMITSTLDAIALRLVVGGNRYY